MQGVGGRTGINPVEVVKIRCKAEAFNSAFDVLFNVGGRVGDSAAAEDIETTLGGDWRNGESKLKKGCLRTRPLTEDLVADIVLPDEFAEKLLVYTGLVYDLAICC